MSHSDLKILRSAVQSGWQIRRATEDDSAVIARFHGALHRPERNDSVASEYFIAESLGNIIGCGAVRARGQLGYLYGLAVAKTWRRQGVGHTLIQCRLDWLHEAGARSAFIFAMFWNIRFFKRHGFILADRKKISKLVSLHQDFTETWCSRSVLLEIECLMQDKYHSNLIL